MPLSFSSLCSDFYINQRLNLKMDLPLRRDTILSLFERVRKVHPQMDRLRRYANEFALETSAADDGQAALQWAAVRKTSLRPGVANPAGIEEGLALHRLLLEVAPFYLDINGLDLEHLELLFGFDLHAQGNHDAIVYKALLAGSPIGALADRPGAAPVECQPMLGVCLSDTPEPQTFLEVKTRSTAGGHYGAAGRAVRTSEEESPISVYLIVRRLAPAKDVTRLPQVMAEIAGEALEIIESVIAPNVLAPLRSCIVTG